VRILSYIYLQCPKSMKKDSHLNSETLYSFYKLTHFHPTVFSSKNKVYCPLLQLQRSIKSQTSFSHSITKGKVPAEISHSFHNKRFCCFKFWRWSNLMKLKHPLSFNLYRVHHKFLRMRTILNHSEQED